MNFDRRALLALDVETTGPDPFIHQVLAISIVPFDLNAEPVTVYVRNEGPLNWTEPARGYFPKYRAEWQQSAVPPSQAAKALSDYLLRLNGPEELSFVGHNIGFDISFLKRLWQGLAIPRVSHRTIDTHTMLRVLAWMGRIPESTCTSSAAFEFFGVAPDTRTRHTAFGDAVATRDLFLRLMDEFEDAQRLAPPLPFAAGSRRIGRR
jgi:DNA polymerase III epsilon subunit-like protein